MGAENLSHPSLREGWGTRRKYKTGKSCLYIRSLADVDRKVLTKLIQQSVRHMKRTYA